ncbi:OPT superfamily oligopeptide transporter [Coemansia reversa NRRL 1564]|uniref:OPT superfamily oligopeptide transporter n=1 Tax=Coemansia reversa (strain ATCC 12441 / NRRL 1564) TaxID=763665 RepID=A0A2G5B3P8_COERN|nr:OPT superfamily oligopeptide transporter [Coemansia reversa NRRL 1564]|eukprot:PIA13653.1 OPT superfamily oligopeptide transporter [Coemansia reversa NRRL 1564]
MTTASHSGESLDNLPQSSEQRTLHDAEKQDSRDAALFEVEDNEDSPFEMVRTAVSNKDNPDLPCLTFRAWVLGILFCAGLAFVNQFYWFRENSIVLGGFVVQLLSFPLGYVMALVLPTRTINTFGIKWTLNPGPFNIKEHVIISIFAGASVSTAYGIDVVTIKRMWYKSDMGFGASVLFILTSQILGYSFAGFSRRFLVYPAAMVWPSTLISVTLFRTFHEVQNIGGRFTRTQMFWMCFVGSFVWYFVPGVIFPALGFLSILCFAAPRNIIANQLGDAFNGVGMLNFSLDWSYISSAYTQSPIAIPWVYACNVFAGFVIIMWIAAPIGYYTNTWNTQLMPIYSASVYTENGTVFDIEQVMTPNRMLDVDKYESYGPLRMTFAFAMTYGLGFAGLLNLMSYIALNYGHDIVRRVREAHTMDEDVHMRLMRRYKEVPHWWYGLTFVVMFALAIVTCQVYKLMAWYWVIVATVIPFVFTVPIGIVQALSNQQPGLNVITEFIIGYARPGDPIANVTFKVYGYITMTQALALVSDQKLGHYMKIPPRKLFVAQLVGTVVAAFVQLGVAYWLMGSVENMCTEAGYPFTCIQANTFFSASVIWGLVGPERMFGTSSPYHPVLYLFITGLLLPLPFWLWQRRFPQSWVRHIHTPLLFIAIGYMPPAPSHVYTNWFIGCFFFNYLWHKYRNVQWSRYAFALSAGLDCGLAISGIITYFAFLNVNLPTWWGLSTHHCPLAPYGKANQPT